MASTSEGRRPSVGKYGAGRRLLAHPTCLGVPVLCFEHGRRPDYSQAERHELSNLQQVRTRSHSLSVRVRVRLNLLEQGPRTHGGAVFSPAIHERVTGRVHHSQIFISSPVKLLAILIVR